MLKIIVIAGFAFATIMALVFVCACVVGSRYEKGSTNSEKYDK